MGILSFVYSVFFLFFLFFFPAAEQEVMSQWEALFPFRRDRHLSEFVSGQEEEIGVVLFVPLEVFFCVFF